MVQLVIRLSENAGEWGLVELQGQLETRDQVPFDNMHIGDLHFDSRGVPNLIIGHHLLTGKVLDLEKPYAVLRKRGGGKRSAKLEPADEDSMDDGDQRVEQTATEYEVIALVTKKIIFKNRPKPIITKALPRKLR